MSTEYVSISKFKKLVLFSKYVFYKSALLSDTSVDRKLSWKYRNIVPLLVICLYSGFNFSHCGLPFPTRCCIPCVGSGLCQLVVRVRGFRVSAHGLDTHCMIQFCPSAWTPRFQRVELCIASARTTLAVSAVAPS